MASNQNLGNGVLFSAEFNGMVQIPVFRQAHHYKFSKNHFSGCQDQKFLFTSLCLSSRAGSPLPDICQYLFLHA